MMKHTINFSKLDAFTQSYIQCSLWSSTDFDCNPLDDDYDICDISESTLQEMIDDCKEFQEENWDMIHSNLSQAGHDFWLTRNHHGAGFWDGGWNEYGSILTQKSHEYGSVDLYVGDDGMIYS